MQLRAKFTRKNTLELTAATFSKLEFRALETVLRKAGLGGFFRGVPFRKLPDDKAGRTVRRYELTQEQVQRVEELLEGRFDKLGLFSPIGSQSGSNYACGGEK